MMSEEKEKENPWQILITRVVAWIGGLLQGVMRGW
jgi:hypothetical protein